MVKFLEVKTRPHKNKDFKLNMYECDWTHLEYFEVVLRFFYQVFDGKMHSLSVPKTNKTTTTTQK